MAITRVAILGSTGSIGTSALSVVDAHPDRLQVVALAAGNNVPVFADQVRKYVPRAVALASAQALREVGVLADLPACATSGAEGLIAVATHPDVDVLLCASSGTAALEAVMAAIDCGKTIALANKEVLVMAGGLVMEAARRRG
jgi:1-deoxy-D-xylulose-5-phosphate reductoisomerase